MEADGIVRRQLPYTLTGTAIASIFVAIFLVGRIEAWIIYAWLAAALGSCVLGYIVSLRSDVVSDRPTARYETFAGSVLGGSIWGSVALIGSITNDPLVMTFVSMFVIFMTVAAAAGLGAHPNNYYGFLLPSISGLAFSFLLYDLAGGYVFFVSSLFYMLFLVFFNRNIYHTTIEAIKLRIENEDLLVEVQRQAAKADQANADKSRFLAAASHDLRQPLHALNLFANSIDDSNLDDDTKQIVDRIRQSMIVLERMFTELLDVSRLDAGAIIPNPGHFPLGALLTRLNQEFAPIAEEKQLEFVADNSEAVVYSDPLLCERILRNILSNAFSYTMQGRVTVKTSEENGMIVVSIQDTGIGIAKDKQELIYSEFEQLQNPERNRNKGLGLGLAIVRRLCDLLDLRLDLQSSPGVGSTFKLCLPPGDIKQLAQEAESTDKQFIDTLSGKTVLVIDDDTMILEGMRAQLDNWNCKGCFAENDSQAKQILQQQKPDLIICDYSLRAGKNGLEVLRDLQEYLGSSIPSIILTGDTNPDVIQSILAESNSLVLHKPIQSARLRTAMSSLI